MLSHCQAETKLRSVLAEKAALAREVKEVRAALEAAQQPQGREQARHRLLNGLGGRAQQANAKARAPRHPPLAPRLVACWKAPVVCSAQSCRPWYRICAK